MAADLMKASLFDNSRDFSMLPCNLRLDIAEKSFAAKADREGRRGLGLIWVIQEFKHLRDTRYLQGDVQLAACMLAAWQEDYDFLKLDNLPPQIMGIKFVSDVVRFYSMKPSINYLISLKTGLPKEDLHVLRSPPLELSNPKDRLDILLNLWSMRKQGLLMNKITRVQPK